MFDREFEYQGEMYGYYLDRYKPYGVTHLKSGEDMDYDKNLYQAACEDAAEYLCLKHEEQHG